MQKRALICYILLLMGFLGLYLRLLYLTSDPYAAAAAESQRRYTVTAVSERGLITDRNGTPLVDPRSRYRGLFSFADGALSAAEVMTCTGLSPQQLYDKMKTDKPFIADVALDRLPETIRFPLFNYSVRGSVLARAVHIVGYTDASGQTGKSGIELALDDVLSRTVDTKVVYQLDGRGRVFQDTGYTTYKDVPEEPSGVALTIDLGIQAIVESAAAELLPRGAIVVTDIATGSILASCSTPTFSPTEVGKYLQDADSPLLNRAFSAYSVGSIFKIAVAAAALESGVSPDFSYTCTGEITVGDTTFRCHHKEGHGALDMAGAMAVSCNPYFIALGNKIGYNKVYAMAEALGFSSRSVFGGALRTASGTLPWPTDMTSDASASNIYFGQGQLSATPLQLTAAMAAIAGGGIYRPPVLVKSLLMSDGTPVEGSGDSAGERRAMSEKTAETLRGFLRGVVTDGSGHKAMPTLTSAGGKTGSAQTGQYGADGKELVQAWFVGYFPAEEPRCAVTVLYEGGVFGSERSAPIFARIADAMTREGYAGAITLPPAAEKESQDTSSAAP